MNNSLYIGIIGQSGDKKELISRLIGNTIAWQYTHNQTVMDMDYMCEFIKWCDKSPEELTEAKDVYYASFADPLKAIISMITCIPMTLMMDHESKCNYIVNIKTFEYKPNDGTELVIAPEKLFKQRTKKLSLEYDDKQELPDVWMVLNDYIIYFGYYLCRNYMGKDVWVNVERRSNSAYPPNKGIRIYTDIRSISEKDYIKEMGGIIIRLSELQCFNSIIHDSTLFDIPVDFELDAFHDVKEMMKDIFDLCLKIVLDRIGIATGS